MSAEEFARALAGAIPNAKPGGMTCVFCGHSIASQDSGGAWSFDDDVDLHEGDCPWRAARVWSLANPSVALPKETPEERQE